MMARSNVPGAGGDFFTTVDLDADEHAAAVEISDSMVKLTVFGPVVNVSTTLDRSEARAVALAVIDASQQIDQGNRHPR